MVSDTDDDDSEYEYDQQHRDGVFTVLHTPPETQNNTERLEPDSVSENKYESVQEQSNRSYYDSDSISDSETIDSDDSRVNSIKVSC